ncbi:MAG: hypothetical protein ACI9U2_000929 [Bradymonadia bacterium]|jgi:hypothetical protein
MLTVRSALPLILACTCLSACTAAWTGSAGAVGLLAVGWLLFATRSNAADAGFDAEADAAADASPVDMGTDAAPEIINSVCLRTAQPGAALTPRVAIQARARAALPADVQARLKD